MKTILTAGSFQFPTPLAPSSATRFSLMAFKSAVSTIDRSTVYSVNSPRQQSTEQLLYRHAMFMGTSNLVATPSAIFAPGIADMTH